MPMGPGALALSGTVSEVDAHGYGKITAEGGKIVLFKLSQVKTPAGANVGSSSFSLDLLGEAVDVRAQWIDDTLMADSVIVLDTSKWAGLLLKTPI